MAASTVFLRPLLYNLKKSTGRLRSSTLPWINVLTRTSSRPNFFSGCRKSVIEQTYPRIRHLVSVDTDHAETYAQGTDVIRVERLSKEGMTNREMEGKTIYPAPYNLYLNSLMNRVEDGWILYLDDDDAFPHRRSVEQMVSFIRSEDEMLLWRVGFPRNVLVPDDRNFGRRPVICDISGIGFAFHVKWKSHAQWDNYSCCDYRVISRLYDIIPAKIWIDRVFTKLQRLDARGGLGQQTDRKGNPECQTP